MFYQERTRIKKNNKIINFFHSSNVVDSIIYLVGPKQAYRIRAAPITSAHSQTFMEEIVRML